MTQSLNASTARLQARIAGVLYLFVILTGGFAEAIVRQGMIVSGDAMATARNIVENPFLYRLGFAADLTNFVIGIPIIVIFYNLFRPVNRSLALLALLFDLLSNAIQSTNLIGMLAPLRLLGGSHTLAVFVPAQLQAMALNALGAVEEGYGVALVFFGAQCLVSGYLIFRSTFLPRVLGILYALAGVCYLINSFSIFLKPALANFLFPYILMPCLLGEGALCLWLIAFGINARSWDRLSAAPLGE